MDFIKKNRKNACHFKNNAYLCNAFSDEPIIGRLAQLVQSICLTSRGSGVRIPQRPPKNFPIACTHCVASFFIYCRADACYMKRKGMKKG